jgi:hypothetical protein
VLIRCHPIVRVLFAIGLGMAGVPPAQAAGHTKNWPGAGSWRVFLGEGSASPVCTVLALPQQSGDFTYMAAFSISKSSTHFYIQFDGKGFPSPHNVTLFADETPLTAEVAEAMPSESVKAAIFRIDLPGKTLAQTIMPALMRAQTLLIRLDTLAFSIPTPNFDRVRDDLASCADVAINQKP